MSQVQSLLNSTLFWQIVFLITGIITTLGYQFVYYSGAATQSSLLPVAANFYGTALAYFIPERKAPRIISLDNPKFQDNSLNVELHVKVALVALLEVVASSVEILGIIYAGSGIYQVIYSSIVIMNALLSRFFLHKIISERQWFSILIVSLGLTLSSFGSGTAKESSETTSWVVGLGIVFAVLSTMLYALHYVISEAILIRENAPTPEQLQTMNGGYAALLVSVYLLVYTIPNFSSLVVENVEEAGGVWSHIVLTYLVLILSGFLHSVAFFRLLGSVGSVSTGILQSLRAVSVFFLSSWFFCSSYVNQCLTSFKLMSAVVVMLGVISFVQSSPRRKKGNVQEL